MKIKRALLAALLLAAAPFARAEEPLAPDAVLAQVHDAYARMHAGVPARDTVVQKGNIWLADL